MTIGFLILAGYGLVVLFWAGCMIEKRTIDSIEKLGLTDEEKWILYYNRILP